MQFNKTRGTAFDAYQKLVNQQRVQIGMSAVQTAITTQMAGSLHQLQGEMAAIHQMNLEGLAIQQELLKREQLQAEIEEFIYNVQKMVQEFSDASCPEPSTGRYFALKGVAETVQDLGLGTPLIRGRDNKAAFESSMKEVNKLKVDLESDEEVIEALAWVRAEKQRRLEAKRKQQEEEEALASEQRRQQQRVAEAKDARRNELLNQIEKLKLQRKTLIFTDWYREKFDAYLHRKPPFDKIPFLSSLSNELYSIVAGLLLWGPAPFGICYGCVWIPIMFSKEKTALNATIDAEISKLEAEVSSI